MLTKVAEDYINLLTAAISVFICMTVHLHYCSSADHLPAWLFTCMTVHLYDCSPAWLFTCITIYPTQFVSCFSLSEQSCLVPFIRRGMEVSDGVCFTRIFCKCAMLLCFKTGPISIIAVLNKLKIAKSTLDVTSQRSTGPHTFLWLASKVHWSIAKFWFSKQLSLKL